MTEREAAELIRTAVGEPGRLWADVGAGTGTFAKALRSLLPRTGHVYAVDSDPVALAKLTSTVSGVTAIHADFTRPFALPDESKARLDGLLMANALHFVADQEDVLRRLARHVRPGGRVVIVEYDQRAASRWVPFPIRGANWPVLAGAAGLDNPRITARMPSRYAGELYAGAADVPR